jgi:hypothetical protein
MSKERVDVKTLMFTHDERDLSEFITELQKERALAKKMGYTDLKVKITEDWGYYDDLSVYLSLTGAIKTCICGKPVEKGTTACKKHNVKPT